MRGYHDNIESATNNNNNFREVLYTGENIQLVLMSIQQKEEIGMETHSENDQFFRFESGIGKVVIDENEYEVSDGFGVVVPAGAEHNVINTSDEEELKLYTIYSPPHHRDHLIRATKAEAEADAPEFDGETTE